MKNKTAKEKVEAKALHQEVAKAAVVLLGELILEKKLSGGKIIAFKKEDQKHVKIELKMKVTVEDSTISGLKLVQ